MQAQVENLQQKDELVTLSRGIVQILDAPINRILELSEQLAASVRFLDPDEAQHQEEIRSEIRRLSFLCAWVIRSLALYCQPVSTQMESGNLNSIVQDVLKIVAPQFPNPDKIRLEADLEDNIPELVCDRSLLMEMLLQLISNARDAIPFQGTIFLKTSFERHSNAVIVEVRDTGIGIPADERERIFDPFFSSKPEDRGRGLGLSVVAGIVRLHNGELHVGSAVGQGTFIQIRLPIFNAGQANDRHKTFNR